MAHVGGALYASGGMLVLLTVLLPSRELYSPPSVAAVGLVALAVGAFFVWSARHLTMPLWLYAIATSCGSVLVTIAALGGGPDTTATYGVLYVFVSTYGFYFYPWPLATWFVVLDGIGFAIVLAFHHVDAAFAQWLMIVGAAVIAGGLIGTLGRRVRRLLAAEQATVRALSHLNAWKTTFLRAAAHDLRSPLAVMIGGLKTFQHSHDRLTAEQRDLLIDRAIASGDRLQQLLTDLLDIERIEAGQIEPRLETVALHELVRECIANIDLADHAADIDLEPITAAVEPAKVDRIVENLLRNAVVHTPPDTPVRIRLRRDGDAAVLTVEDDGPGFGEELAEHLFDAFQRGAGRESGSGLGLGLHLVRQFAELHGGSVAASNAPGGGARFEVRLPVT